MPAPSLLRSPTARLLSAALVLLTTGCSLTRTAVSAGMLTAHRPEKAASAPVPSWAQAAGMTLLAGDLHCHVTPPDPPGHVDRDPAQTVDLVEREGLDFAVLTPHVTSRFFTDPGLRGAVLEGRALLRAAIDARPHKATFIVGMEYTDPRFGHVGAAFADVEAVLGEVPIDVARADPARYFERFVAHGGVLVLNHPLVTPLDSGIAIARADLSWRPLTAPGPFPPEIVAIDALAQGVEAFNVSATELRDRFLLHDTTRTLSATLARMDREIPKRGRRMTPVGGSDSHSDYIRATTFVWSRGRGEAEIRDAIVAGRVCVRSPEACSLQARTPGGAWVGVGGSIHGAQIEVHAEGGEVEIFVDGAKAATPRSGEAAVVTLPEGRCAVVRARVGAGYSAPIYGNCPFADGATP